MSRPAFPYEFVAALIIVFLTAQRVPISQAANLDVGSKITVNFSDTLTSIANAYTVDLSELGRMNGIVNPRELVAGQEIALPETTPLRSSYSAGSLLRSAFSKNELLYKIMLENKQARPNYMPAGGMLALPDRAPTLDLPWINAGFTSIPMRPGTVTSLHATTERAGLLEVIFQGTPVPVMSEGFHHHSLIAIDRYSADGVYPLTMRFTDTNGVVYELTRKVLIRPAVYPSEHIRVTGAVAEMLNNPGVMENEVAYINATMSGYTKEQYWQGMFLMPAAGVLTSGFGTSRSYNGSGFNSYHSGADLAAKKDTIVYAPADGVVVTVEYLSIRGNIVIMDHGLGVFSGFWHLNSAAVSAGDFVKRGQVIGAVGNTGLSTASHLHWEMSVNNTKVDPMQWVRYVFP